jgi:hypothetical protein
MALLSYGPLLFMDHVALYHLGVLTPLLLSKSDELLQLHKGIKLTGFCLLQLSLLFWTQNNDFPYKISNCNKFDRLIVNRWS